MSPELFLLFLSATMSSLPAFSPHPWAIHPSIGLMHLLESPMTSSASSQTNLRLHHRSCHTSAANAAASNFGVAPRTTATNPRRIETGTLIVSYLNTSTVRSMEMVEKFRISVASALQSLKRKETVGEEDRRTEALEAEGKEDHRVNVSQTEEEPMKRDQSTTDMTPASMFDFDQPRAPEPFNAQRWLHDRERHLIEKRSFMGIDLSSDDFPEPSYTAPPVKSEPGKWRTMATRLVNQASLVFAKSEPAAVVEDSPIAEPQEESPSLTHVDLEGNARMVDVGEKAITRRTAVAEGSVLVGPQILRLLRDNQLKKGDALTVAQIAGVMAAKRTSDLIPLCHNIVLNDIQVQLKLNDVANAVRIRSAVRCDGRTGAEMEALTAVTVAALTLYDMCKAVSKDMVIGEVKLVEKTGGKSEYDAKRSDGGESRKSEQQTAMMEE